MAVIVIVVVVVVVDVMNTGIGSIRIVRDIGVRCVCVRDVGVGSVRVDVGGVNAVVVYAALRRSHIQRIIHS